MGIDWISNNSNNKSPSSNNMTEKCRFGARNSLEFSWQCFIFAFESDWSFRLKTFYFITTIILTVTLNLFIIFKNLNQFQSFRTVHTKKKKKIISSSLSVLYYKTNMSFTSNAIADLICGSTIMTFTYISILFEHWPFTVNWCLAWSISDFSIGTCSLLHMLIIAHDRLMSLKNPFKQSNLQISTHNMNVMKSELRSHFCKLLVAWFCAFLFWTPLLVPTMIKQNPVDYYTCDVSLSGSIILPHSFLVYFLPIIFILVFYFLSFYYLHKNLKKLVTNNHHHHHYPEENIKVLKTMRRNMTDPNLNSAGKSKHLKFALDSLRTQDNPFSKSSECIKFIDQSDEPVHDYSHAVNFDETCDNLNSEDSMQAKIKRKANSFGLNIRSTMKSLPKNEIKVFKRLLFITTAFLVCWLPWCIIWNYQAFHGYDSVPVALSLASFLLAYANSFINPLTIIFTNSRYRTRLMKEKKAVDTFEKKTGLKFVGT